MAYVAITRARKRLFLTYAATRRTYGSTQANPRSRFVNEIPEEHIEFSGIGSSGFSGTGWEKRGDRRGTFGSGTGSDMYGGNVFGSYTRSTGSGRRVAPHGHQPRCRSQARDLRQRSVALAPCGCVQHGRAAPSRCRARGETFAPGDTVSHKTFGTGKVISAEGDMIEVQFDKTGQTKRLMKGFAPIVKLS